MHIECLLLFAKRSTTRISVYLLPEEHISSTFTIDYRFRLHILALFSRISLLKRHQKRKTSVKFKKSPPKMSQRWCFHFTFSVHYQLYSFLLVLLFRYVQHLENIAVLCAPLKRMHIKLCLLLHLHFTLVQIKYNNTKP